MEKDELKKTATVLSTTEEGDLAKETAGESSPYDKFLQQKMKDFGATSPSDITPDQWGQIDEEWKAKKATFSFWPGIICLLVAGVVKLIGYAWGESVSDAFTTTFYHTGMKLQKAANIHGTTDVLMTILGIIGIILLIRAAGSLLTPKETEN